MGVVSASRIGVFGGTFDPIHVAHLAVAEDCRAQLALDELLFVPTGHPPHKQGRQISSVVDRVAMVELAIADNPRFSLSRVDVDRPGLSYTVDTLRDLRLERGPDVDFFFIVGGDSLRELGSWRNPDQIFEECQVVAVNRPGYPTDDLTMLERAAPRSRGRVIQLMVPELAIAASDLRRRVATGQSIRYLVPDSVWRYIERQQLYSLNQVARPSR